MSDNSIIRTSGLDYCYSKSVKTIKDIDLNVERGNIYGFLGPNGSGKTTTLRLLLGLLEIQKGTIEIFGRSFNSDRTGILKRIGSLIETPSLYGHLNARENLEVYRAIYGAPKSRIAEVLRIAGLEDTGRKAVRSFSLGMKQRLSIALALLPNPELLILDEPSNGLDPGGIIELRAMIRKLNREKGMTILMSSHILSEVEKMVSHVGIIFKGEMLFQGSLAQLNAFQKKQSTLMVHTSDNEAAMNILQEYQPERLDEAFCLSYDGIQQVADISRRLHRHDLDVYLLHPQESDLEQLFIDLTHNHV